MTLVPTSVTSAELTTLAKRINEGHRLTGVVAKKTLEAAVGVGYLLLDAYELVPPGEWWRWLRDNCDFDLATARVYQRVAHYEHELADALTLREAITSLRGLPSVHPVGNPNSYPAELKAKARAMLAEGQTPTRVAEQLGISPGLASSWRRSDKEINRNIKKLRRRRTAARKALKEKETHEAVMAAASPSLAELYSRVRLAQDVADAAILDHSDDQNFAGWLREARSFLNQAESRIVKALGVE